MADRRKISVIGLGYVGLPVAIGFAKAGFEVVGFDIDEARIGELRGGHDRTGEIADADLAHGNLLLSTDPVQLKRADFHIITVPTPIDDTNRPDLGALLAATRTIGKQLKKGDIVVYESTVYPGATEEDCVPLLAGQSGLTFGRDFTVGYSPERINPGDKQHRFETIVKVVSGSDHATLDIVARTYGAVVTVGVHRAPNIRVAEASKVIENTQRDLNIALINELALIFDRMSIDTRDVLEAAATKWNFLPFRPGLVGGHCIGVDPFYLTHKAESVGYHPQVILAGRRVNDGMGLYIANRVARNLMRRGWTGERPRAVILGFTFKEDVPDIRNTRVADIARELRNFGIESQIHDPLADATDVAEHYGLTLTPAAKLQPADAVVLAVGHAEYARRGWELVNPLVPKHGGIVIDIPGLLDRATQPKHIHLWRL